MVVLTGKIGELCSVWQIRRNFLTLMFLLSSSSFCFFLINFQMKNVEGYLVTLTIVSQLAEFFANLSGGYLYNKVGPKMGFSSMFLLSTLGSIMLFIKHDDKKLIPVFVAFAKFGIAASFNECFIAFVKLIPTIFVSSVFGFCNFPARFVTVLAPQIAEMPYTIVYPVLISFTVMAAFLSQCLLVKLPKYK